MKSFTVTLDKPILYFYPEKEENIRISFDDDSSLLYTYPKYLDEWDVRANPSGNLIDLRTGRNLYALYYESKASNNQIKKDGFCVKGEDTISFLEEKLKLLGLNEREANEFIIYWLPKLESNKYNYIRFETMDEINEKMPINIDPEPDTFIRVLMDYKPLDKCISLNEQELYTPARSGFTVVEWGGTEIK